jgi:YesN/AraC family two-component response regulator
METVTPKVLLTDIYMPDMNGLELIVRARRICPGLKIVTISGGGNARHGDSSDTSALSEADAILRKPITRAALIETVTAFLDGPLPPKP